EALRALGRRRQAFGEGAALDALGEAHEQERVLRGAREQRRVVLCERVEPARGLERLDERPDQAARRVLERALGLVEPRVALEAFAQELQAALLLARAGDLREQRPERRRLRAVGRRRSGTRARELRLEQRRRRPALLAHEEPDREPLRERVCVALRE